MGKSKEKFIELQEQQDQEMSVPHIFTQNAPTKTQIETGAKAIVKAVVDDGEADPLRVATAMKAIEIAMKIIKSGIEDAMVDEAEKEGQKTFTRNGHQYQIRAAATRYDFSLCGDPALKKMEAEMADLSANIKNRQTFLKGLTESETIADKETGEMVEVFPPSKSSKTTVAITLAK